MRHFIFDLSKEQTQINIDAQLSKYSQCAEEKSNESVEDMDGTFTGW